jgi:hypothetical protein
MIAFLQLLAGTKIILASHYVSFLASKQFLNTGTPKCIPPNFLGFTPPTILVPYC